MPQGVLLKKHKVRSPKNPADPSTPLRSPPPSPPTLGFPPPTRVSRIPHSPQVPKNDGTFITWHDIAVGEILTLYSRSYYVTGADPFTRNFYADRGVQARAPSCSARLPPLLPLAHLAQLPPPRTAHLCPCFPRAYRPRCDVTCEKAGVITPL